MYHQMIIELKTKDNHENIKLIMGFEDLYYRLIDEIKFLKDID